MKEFTIYKDKWVRGDRHHNGVYLGSSLLLNDKGNMCCLGFLGQACGVVDEAMRERCAPTYIHGYPVAEWSGFIKVNDNTTYTDRQRQDKLRRLFKNIGFKVSFKNTEKNE